MALTPISSWSIQSPNGTAWVWTISTAGIITMTSQVTVITATTPVFQGTATAIWTPSIDNSGIVTLTSGVSALQFLGVLSDSSNTRWYPYVEAGGVVTWLTRNWSTQPKAAGA